MSWPEKERRKYERYDTEIRVYFRVNYDVKTKVEFQIINKDKEKLLPKKYFGISRNVSAEGLRFSSEKKLKKGDSLFLEVYLPKQKQPVYMTGEVRWSEKIFLHPEEKYKFDTGVKLINVSGKSVVKSIYFDEENQIFWSVVLDSIFGNFRKFMEKYKKRRPCLK